MKNKLFLDVDDTLTMSSKTYCSVYNFLYKYNPLFKPADYTKNTDWNFAKECPLAKDKTEAIFGSTYFFDFLELFPNAINVLKKLKENYQIIIVSIGTHDNISLKTSYLADNLPFIDDFIGIVNSGCIMDKSIINMASKDENSKNIFLDDNEGNLFSQQGTEGLIRYCYGIVKPWNNTWYRMNGRWLKDWSKVEKELLLGGN